MIPLITMTVDEAEAAFMRVCDDKQPVLLVTAEGCVPVAVLVDFETYEAVKVGGADALRGPRWGPTNRPALSAA